MPITKHLAELRQRIIVCLVALSVASAVCYAFIDPLFGVLFRLIEPWLTADSSLVFTSYPEAFFAYFKLALVIGIFVASPVLFYELWAFVAPGLYGHERRFVLLYVVPSFVFFIAGGVFGYLVALPAAFKFLAGYSSPDLKLLPKVSQYLDLSISLLLAFGFSFELPVFMGLMGLAGIVHVEMLKNFRRYFIFVAFVAAAILTPTPDVVNQCILAIPLLGLYELGIVFVWVMQKKKVTENKR